jgi:DNA-nicking Smr family endonuclease
VAATVRTRPGQAAPVVSAPIPPIAPPKAPPQKRPAKTATPSPAPPPRLAPAKPVAEPERIEPGRKRRIAREREPIGGRLDLHGLDQDRARAALHAFIARAHEDGARAVLIITGKGVRGDGVLRRRVPDWLAEAPSRARVAGYAMAERHHGGEGALYVALKRLTR